MSVGTRLLSAVFTAPTAAPVTPRVLYTRLFEGPSSYPAFTPALCCLLRGHSGDLSLLSEV